MTDFCPLCVVVQVRRHFKDVLPAFIQFRPINGAFSRCPGLNVEKVLVSPHFFTFMKDADVKYQPLRILEEILIGYRETLLVHG